ncbi:MAG TPA: four helix bundle protein [Gammaproteobacteria bacterium]|nr:four helix bundle protein [Gammaproteobacteria bacterium]
MRIHKDLSVWKKSIELAVQIYSMTATFPKQETYGLGQQMRRASVSIASNISEGAARGSPNEFTRFLHMAAGSVSELDTQLEIADAIDIGNLELRNDVRRRLHEVASLLGGLIRSQYRKIRHKESVRTKSAT